MRSQRLGILVVVGGIEAAMEDSASGLLLEGGG